QLRTQFNQLKDTALFALALWFAYIARDRWDFDPLGLATYLYTHFHWEAFNPDHAIEPFSEFQWLYLILIPGVPLVLESQGFYDRPLVGRRRDTAWRLLKGTVLATMGII